jgi:hypothetical protein
MSDDLEAGKRGHIFQNETLEDVPLLAKIESRLGNLESTVQSILDRGDQMNEVTQEKLTAIQEQLETQAASMRRIRRQMYSSYSYKTVMIGVIGIVVIFVFIVHMLSSSI